MATSPPKGKIHDVPAQVFGKFVEVLSETGAPPELIARLRKTLLEDKTFNDRALKAAILGEEPPP